VSLSSALARFPPPRFAPAKSARVRIAPRRKAPVSFAPLRSEAANLFFHLVYARLGQHHQAPRVLLDAAASWHQETGQWATQDL
jgi:hypothetical protein